MGSIRVSLRALRRFNVWVRLTACKETIVEGTNTRVGGSNRHLQDIKSSALHRDVFCLTHVVYGLDEASMPKFFGKGSQQSIKRTYLSQRGPCTQRVYAWALKQSLYRYFVAKACTGTWTIWAYCINVLKVSADAYPWISKELSCACRDNQKTANPTQSQELHRNATHPS